MDSGTPGAGACPVCKGDPDMWCPLCEGEDQATGGALAEIILEAEEGLQCDNCGEPLFHGFCCLCQPEEHRSAEATMERLEIWATRLRLTMDEHADQGIDFSIVADDIEGLEAFGPEELIDIDERAFQLEDKVRELVQQRRVADRTLNQTRLRLERMLAGGPLPEAERELAAAVRAFEQGRFKETFSHALTAQDIMDREQLRDKVSQVEFEHYR